MSDTPVPMFDIDAFFGRGLAVMAGGVITLRQMALLFRLSLDEGQTVKDMAQAMNVHKPTITRASDRLSLGRLNLVRRVPDDVDRRSVFLFRTQKGDDACKVMLGQMTVAEFNANRKAEATKAAQKAKRKEKREAREMA